MPPPRSYQERQGRRAARSRQGHARRCHRTRALGDMHVVLLADFESNYHSLETDSSTSLPELRPRLECGGLHVGDTGIDQTGGDSLQRLWDHTQT